MALGLTRLSGRRRGSLLGLVSLTAIAAALPSLPPVTPPPALAYSNPSDYFVASLGMHWPNRASNPGAGFTKYASTQVFRSSPWIIPAGSSVLLIYPNHTNVEGNAAVNEAQNTADLTIEAVSIAYTDASGTARVAAATALSNGGVLSASLANGGVVATIPLAYAIPAGAQIKIAQALAFADGAAIPACYLLRTGDLAKRHATDSFAAVVASGGNITISGSSTASLGGFQFGPCGMFAKGADGRPIPLIDGDSIAYGKGTPDSIAPDHVAGIVEVALARTTNGYAIPALNFAIAGSGFERTDPANADYNPAIHRHRRALVDQVVAMNGGKLPWTHYICEHGTNSLQTSVDAQKALLKTRHAWLRSWHDAPVIQTTLIPKATSSDGFRTLANQTVFDGSIRGPFRTDLLANKLDGTILYAVDVMAGVAADTDANIGRFAVRPFTATLTRACAANDVTLFLSAPPAIGASLCLDPPSGTGVTRIVIDVVEVTAGSEYQVTTTAGSSSGNYPAKAAGTTLGEVLTADGPTNTIGLHISKIGNDLIAAYQGANSWDAMKAFLKSAVSGAWT